MIIYLFDPSTLPRAGRMKPQRVSQKTKGFSFKLEKKIVFNRPVSR